MTAATFQQPAAGWVKPPVEGHAGQLTSMITEVMHTAMKNHPRSLQAAPGPSELGTPCVRRLAYKILDWPQPNCDRDQWLSTIGTAVHAWQAGVFEQANQLLGRARYLVERKVHLPFGISGSSDLYDRDTATVIDWKVTSLDNIRRYRRNGPGDQYRIQAHLYALGMLLAGEHPQHVADVFLPRGGLLEGLLVWTEPFDPEIAADALRRYDTTRTALIALDPEKYPQRWGLFPTAEAHCEWCPFHLPQSGDLSKGCPGHRTRNNNNT
jgi:hypothetical protein